MAYRGGGGGGDRGDQYQAGYGGWRAGPMGGAAAAGRGGRAPTGFVWPAPGASTPRPAPEPYGLPATVVYGAPGVLTRPPEYPYIHGIVFRGPAPTPPPPVYPFSSAPGTVRAPSRPLSATAAPFQPARVSAPPPTPAAPSAASVAKELEENLFVSETALAPTMKEGQAAEAAPDVELAPVSETALTPTTKEGQAAEAAPDVDLAPVSETALAPTTKEGQAAEAAPDVDLAPISETALAPTAAAVVETTKEGQAAPDVDLAPVSKKGLAHPARPGAGTIGKKEVMIRADHFLVDVADNNLFHYDVSVNPESKSRATNREVLSELIKLHGKKSLGGKLPAYDGRKSLYTAGSLPFNSGEFVVTLVDPEKKDKERAEREDKITIRIAGRTDLFHLQQFLAGRQRDMPQETIQVLDVVLRESPSWNYVTVSRSFFSTTFGHRGDIGEGLECWRGYYQSLRPTQMGLSLNIDISATSFFKPVTVIQFVQEFLNLRDASRPLTDRDRVKAFCPRPVVTKGECSSVLPDKMDMLIPEVHGSSGMVCHPTELDFHQVFVKILDFDLKTILFHQQSSVEDVVFDGFLKLGISLFDFTVSHGRSYITDMQDTLDSLKIRKGDTIHISPRMRGGSSSAIDILLWTHVCTLGDSLFDVLFFPTGAHFPGIQPYFITLGLGGISIATMILDLLESYHSNNQCVGIFHLNDIIYHPSSKQVSFSSNVQIIPWSRNDYYKNMACVGDVVSLIFLFDENKVLRKLSGIHVSEAQLADPTVRGKLPMLVELFVHDLKYGIRSIVGACTEVDYKGGEEQIKSYVGSNSMASQWSKYARKISLLDETFGFRYYSDFLVSAQWSLIRNWLTHATQNTNVKLTLKQAEAFITLVFPFFIYQIILKITFPGAQIRWNNDPRATTLASSSSSATQPNMQWVPRTGSSSAPSLIISNAFSVQDLQLS